MSTTPPVPDHVDTILVPLDGSEFSARALPVASRLAEWLGASVHLLSAVESEDQVGERKALLDTVELPIAQVERTVVVSLDVAGAIHETLRRLGNAVACMSSHGRGRSAALVGSVATEVIGRGHDPLVLVGPRVDASRMVGAIVTCADEHPHSRDVIAVALRWSALLQKRVVVITVAEPVPPPLTAGPPRRRFGPDEDVDLYLSWLVAPFRAQGAEIETKALYNPIKPANGVWIYVEDHPACLVVVGSKPRKLLRHYVLGQTTADIIYASPSPVVVVPLGVRTETE